MQLTAHAPLQAFVYHLMLLNACFAPKPLVNYVRSVMITVAAKVFNANLCTGKIFFDEFFNFICDHGHRNFSELSARRGWPPNN